MLSARHWVRCPGSRTGWVGVGRILGLCLGFSLTLALASSSVFAMAQEEPAAEVEPEVSPEVSDEFENLPSQDVAEAHQAVLARDDFQRLMRAREDEEEDEEESRTLPNWLERFLDWLDEFFSRRGSEGESADESGGLPVLSGMVYLAAAVLLISVLVVIAIALFKKDRSDASAALGGATDPGSVATPPGHQSPNAYMQRARDFAGQGDYRLAIRELLLGSMSYLERAGTIRYRRGLTNRDYLYSARGERRQSLTFIIQSFEKIFYGRREATQENFSECLALFSQSFREVEANPQ